jgi:hypothetical protein
MEPKGSKPNAHELSTCSYPEPNQSNPHHPSHLSKIHHNITHLHLGLPSNLFPSGFPTNNLYAGVVLQGAYDPTSIAPQIIEVC